MAFILTSSITVENLNLKRKIGTKKHDESKNISFTKRVIDLYIIYHCCLQYLYSVFSS